MASLTFNITLGMGIALHDRVVGNDPANSCLILVPIETSGLVSDDTMSDYDTLAAVLAGASNEQTTMGRKTLTNADLSASAVDDSTNVRTASLPDVDWAAASGNAISKVLVCYAPDSTSLSDSTTIPITHMDFVASPDGNLLRLTAGVYLEAARA
jgi:hypothetical protein